MSVLTFCSDYILIFSFLALTKFHYHILLYDLFGGDFNLQFGRSQKDHQISFKVLLLGLLAKKFESDEFSSAY